MTTTQAMALPLPPISALVPHSGGMLLLDALLEAGDSHATAVATVRATQLFADGDGVPGWLGIEYMAQTIAAWSGACNQRAALPPAIGFLLGSRRYESDVAVFPIGSELIIHVRSELIGDNGLGMFACTVSMNGREVARANVSVFQPADAQAFLQGHPA